MKHWVNNLTVSSPLFCKYSVSRLLSTEFCVPYFMDDIYIIPNVTLFSPGFWLLEVFVEIVPKVLSEVDSVEVSESWLPWFPNTSVLVLTTKRRKKPSMLMI